MGHQHIVQSPEGIEDGLPGRKPKWSMKKCGAWEVYFDLCMPIALLALMLVTLTASAGHPPPNATDQGSHWRDVCDEFSLEQCADLARQGDVNAQYFLAAHYVSQSDMRGHKHPAPEVERMAFEWMAQAARQGHIRAQLRLGHFYEQGRFVPADREQALGWYQRAAEHGDLDAKRALADLKGAVAQGHFENVIFLVCLLAIFIFPSVSRGDRSLAAYARRFWFWAPHFTSLFIAAWWVSRGAWGRSKHPFLGSLMDGITPEVATNLFILMPVLSGLIYLLAFYRYPQDRRHFWVSLSIYIPMILTAVVFGYFMAQLAKLA